MHKDKYLTIETPAEAIFKDRGSRFLAYAFPVQNEYEISMNLENLRKLHPKARHHCFAWRLGLSGDSYRANDAGEPSGTGGKPILGQIDSFNLTNVLIVVIRYFGGTLLGTSGLINAYKTASKESLENSKIVEKFIEVIIELSAPYQSVNSVMTVLKQYNVVVLNQVFELKPFWVISLRASMVERFRLDLISAIEGISLEEALNREPDELFTFHINE
jgi:uncharacterized YigZ family protein